MRRLAATLTLAVALAFLGSGCASSYVMKLSNGVRITTASKPKLKSGRYYYKDAAGHEQSVPMGRVVEIAPSSETEPEKNVFKPTPSH